MKTFCLRTQCVRMRLLEAKVTVEPIISAPLGSCSREIDDARLFDQKQRQGLRSVPYFERDCPRPTDLPMPRGVPLGADDGSGRRTGIRNPKASQWCSKLSLVQKVRSQVFCAKRLLQRPCSGDGISNREVRSSQLPRGASATTPSQIVPRSLPQ